MVAVSRVALVTGANHGIGAAVAERLAADGFAVAITFLAFDEPDDPGIPQRQRASYRRDASGVLERIRATGGQAIAISADLSEAATVPLLFDETERTLGPVDVLIHNATASLLDSFRVAQRDWANRRQSPVTPETIDRQFSIDARAGALLIAEFATRLQQRGGTWGRIVALTSGGERGFPGEVSYGAAKAALVNYTLSASIELGRFGVTANALHPPVTDTGWVTDQVRKAVEADDNFLSVAEPAEVAEVIGFLVSDAGRRITGNVIRMG